MRRLGRLPAALVALACAAPAVPAVSAAGDPGSEATTGSGKTLTALWRDAPDDPASVRIEPVQLVPEPSDLLLLDGVFWTVSDKVPMIFRLDRPEGAEGAWRARRFTPAGMPEKTDLEAMAVLPGGEVLIASETNGAIFVMAQFPERVCAAWMTGVDSRCFIGPDNCGIEALAVVPGGRLFVAKERETRGAWFFDLPGTPCAGHVLTGRTYLKLPDEVGADISAATYDAASGHLLLIARSRQRVLEFEVPPPTPGDTSPRSLRLLGEFSYARTERALGYPGGLFYNQFEGIAVDADRVLHLMVDNNRQESSRFGDRRAALVRFYPAQEDGAGAPVRP